MEFRLVETISGAFSTGRVLIARTPFPVNEQQFQGVYCTSCSRFEDTRDSIFMALTLPLPPLPLPFPFLTPATVYAFVLL